MAVRGGENIYVLDMDELPPAQQAQKYLVEYSFERKQRSLWRVDPDALSVPFVLDLPSRGDTCFASALGAGEHEMTVYNYTSPLDGEDLDWLRAQGGPTIIGAGPGAVRTAGCTRPRGVQGGGLRSSSGAPRFTHSAPPTSSSAASSRAVR